MKRVAALVMIGMMGTCFAAKPKTPQASTIVDSGTFDVLVRGMKVASETFQIEQRSTGSVTHSELRMNNSVKPNQVSEMDINANGELARYEWQDPSAQSTVVIEPSDEFLVEHLTYPGTPDADDKNAASHPEVKAGVTMKSQTLPHILPTTTPVLDDNFFSHRELLMWRYLASECAKRDGANGLACQFNKQSYGVLVPNQHTATTVTIEYSGNKATSVGGVARVAEVYKLVADDVEWQVMVDPTTMKVIRMEIPSQETEIVRE